MSDDPKHEERDQRLTNLLGRLQRAVHGLQFADGLNPAQWEALRYVARANRYSRQPGALAAFLGTTKGTASQTVKSLEAKGYVDRAPLARDRRAVRLELTAEGASMLERDPMREVARAAGAWDARDLDTMTGLLARLLRGVQEGSGGREFGVCEDCRHLGRGPASDGYCCGLMGERLSASEVRKICVDYSAAAG